MARPPDVSTRLHSRGGAAIGVATVAVALLAFTLLARTARPGVESAHLVSMMEGAGVLQRAAVAMHAHAQAMLTDGLGSGDQELVAHSGRWLCHGQALAQRGHWLAMAPLVPGSLVSPLTEISNQARWGDLLDTTETMAPGSPYGT